LKSLTEYLWFEVPGRRGFINITPKIEQLVDRSGITEGLCLVNAMHITASVFINDDESGLHHDYEVWLEKLAPHAPTSAFRHNRTGELRKLSRAGTMLTPTLSVRSWAAKSSSRSPKANWTSGRPPRRSFREGGWEQIFYGEFDGGRRKRALVKIMGE
jgi:thiamine phosphate synthase YjbQ (UPF0047 family)